jgi:membrane associated rhomboid family serine protease
MIPLRDVIPSRTFPFVTITIIILNALAFVFELSLDPRELSEFLRVYGVVPADFHMPTLITSMFLHGGWSHILGNMWYLWIFGDNVEDQCGHGRFVVFYLLCGIAAAVGQIVMNPQSALPTIGASGAIAGVMGAYFILYPRARVLTWWIFFAFWLPAWLVLGYWFLGEFLSGAASVFASSGGAGGVAFWAHVGGFVTGVLLIKLLPVRKNVYAFEDY